MATYDLKYPGAAIDAILDTAYDLQNAGYIFRGLASEYSNTPTERSWVLAGEGETGHGFTTAIPKGYIGVCVFDGTSWTGKLVKCVSIDSTPTPGSTNAVSSGGAYAALNQLATGVAEALDNMQFTDVTPPADEYTQLKLKLATTDSGIERIITYLTFLSATTSKAGLLSAADKAKLDAILGNLRSLKIDDTTAYADLGDKIVESIKATIGGTEETISTFQILAATASKAGLLSAADKAKLDALWSSGYQFVGIATPSTTPINTTSKIFYIATEAGTYFNAVTVTQGINILSWDGSAWSAVQVVGIDEVPAAWSDNLVKSGGTAFIESEAKQDNISVVIPPDSTQDGYVIDGNGSLVTNSDFRVCVYEITGSDYILSADIPDNYNAPVVHYYDGSTYLGKSDIFKPTLLRKYANIHLDIPSGADTIKVVEAKTKVYPLQTKDNVYQLPSTKKYLAEGIIVYPYVTLTTDGEIAAFLGQRDRHVVVVDIKPDVAAINVGNGIDVKRVVFCNTWNYGTNSIVSYSDTNKGIIPIPNGCKKCVMAIDATNMNNLNNLVIPVGYYQKGDTGNILTGKVILPENVQKGKVHRDNVAEIIDSSSWNLFQFTINADKLYSVTAKYVNSGTYLAHFYDANNNWIGRDSIKWNNLSASGEKVLLRIPVGATKMYINSYGGSGYNAEVRVEGEDISKTVDMREKTAVDYDTIISNKGLNSYTGDTFDSTGNTHYNIYEFTVNPSKEYVLSATLPVTWGVLAVFYDTNENYICDDIYYGKGAVSYQFTNVLLHVPSNAVTMKVNAYSSLSAPVLSELGDEIDADKLKDDVEVLKEAGDAGLPLYYKDYIQGINENINKLFLTSEPLSDAFAFITDVHYPKVSGSGFKVVRTLLDSTPIDKGICGGDIAGRYAKEFGDGTSNIDALAKTIILYGKDCAIVRGGGKPMFTVRGNHDYISMLKAGTAEQGNTSWFSDWKSTRNILMNSLSQYDIVTNYNDDKACYFYKDYPARKLRYVYLDTVDTNQKYGEDNNSMKIGLTDTQIQWVIEQAVLTTPTDYDLVFVAHICPEAIVGGYETKVDSSPQIQFRKLAAMLIAIQEKTILNLTLDSVAKTYDLTSYNPDILLYKSGHLHRDGVAWYGYWGFSSAAEWSDGGNEMEDTKEYQHYSIDTSENPQTAQGTIYESVVDAVVINGRESVESFRIGAGVNRIFIQEQVEVNAGDTVTLESSLGNDVQWWCYDSLNVDLGSQYPNHIGLRNDFATINSDTGVLTSYVTSGISVEGYVTAMAYSESKNTIEYFGVKVV